MKQLVRMIVIIFRHFHYKKRYQEENKKTNLNSKLLSICDLVRRGLSPKDNDFFIVELLDSEVVAENDD